MKIPASVFRNGLTKAMSDLAKPPSRRHRGTRVRVSTTVPFPEELHEESELAAQHGLPAENAQAGMQRDAEGRLKPQDLVEREVSLEEGAKAFFTTAHNNWKLPY